jgi:cytochrome P450
MVALYRTYGPVFRLPEPGKAPRSILAGPEMNTFMARYEDEFFTTRQNWEKFDATISQEQNLISEARDGEANRKRRAGSSRQWSRVRILDQLPQMVEIIQELTGDWHDGSTIPVHATMRRLVAEQLGRLLLGVSPGDYLDDFIIYLNAAITSSFGAGNQPNEAGLNSPRYQRAVERVKEFSRYAYELHLAHPQPNGKPDMLDEAIQQVAGYPEVYRQIMVEGVALGPLLAGIDTVANSLSFMLYAMLANPQAAQRVQAEVEATRKEGPLTWEKLRKMTALNGAMLETLRLYPVAKGHGARVARPLTLAGYRLEVGQDVFVAMTVPHFLEELYPHPFEFDIDRFHEPRNEHRQKGAYAPFGLGDHTCLGSGIAEVQMMVTMATLLASFTSQFDPPDYRLVVEENPTPVPGNNFQVKVTEQPISPFVKE